MKDDLHHWGYLFSLSDIQSAKLTVTINSKIKIGFKVTPAFRVEISGDIFAIIVDFIYRGETFMAASFIDKVLEITRISIVV